VDDDQTAFLLEFHRQLREIRDPAHALRVAQLKLLGDKPALAPIRRWAGFVAIGGMNALRFSEGMTND